MSSPAIIKKVETLISSNPVFISSTTWCPDARATKKLFSEITEAKNVAIVEADIDQDGKEISDYLFELTKLKNIPRVFIGGKYIGTEKEIFALQDEGKLVGLVDAAIV